MYSIKYIILLYCIIGTTYCLQFININELSKNKKSFHNREIVLTQQYKTT